MQDDKLSTTLGRMISAAQLSSTDDETRSDLLDRYNAEPYGDEVEGSSQFIMTDVRDAVEALLPDILDVFTSAESIVEFTPVGPEDEDATKQETEVCSNIFWQKNKGFEILYTWIKEAMIQQNAYVKSGWRDKVRREIEEYENLTPQELQGILANIEGEIDILESTGIDDQGQPVMLGVDPQTGMPAYEPINIRMRITTKEKRYVIECVPNEDIYYTPRWNSVSFDGIPLVGHRSEMERGELRQMGFDEESFKDAGEEHDDEGDAELARHDTKYHFDGDDDDAGDDSTRKVTVYESYVRADIDGDGQAELLQVWSVGDGSQILKWEDGTEAVKEVTGHPFSALTPYLMPHRHVGLSVAELIADLQKINTVLARHTLDNTYRNNHARPSYNEDDAGPYLASDLASPKPGSPIRTGGAQIIWDRPPSVIDVTLPLMQQITDLKEQRTGVTRSSEGLNAESLNQHSEGTVGRIMDAALKKRLLIARTFAETGIRDLFLRMHRDLRSGPMKKIATRIRNQWIDVDPRTWRHRSDMTTSIGKGSGDRDKQRQGLMLMGQLQEKLMMSKAPIVDLQKIYNTAEKLMETYGFESIEPFLIDPAQLPPPDPSQQQPDPQQVMLQAQIESLQAQARINQMKEQTAQAELQMKQQQQEAQLSLQEREAQRDYEIKMAEINRKRDESRKRLELDADKAVLDDDYKRDKMQADAMTGYMRQNARSVPSTPPMSYGEVGS